MPKYTSFSKGVLLAAFGAASILVSCAHTQAPRPQLVANRDGLAESLFRETEGCFLLYNMKTKNLEQVFNKAFCYERAPAAATFEVPLALMAVDSGKLKAEKAEFRWDGKDRGHPAWNQNQTASTWMQESTPWVTQSLTERIGRRKIVKYLRQFGFGNRDFSGDVDGAWMTADSRNFKSRKGTLKISPFEQVDFWESLWNGDLPVSKAALDFTRAATYLGKAHGFVLNGKTGSGMVGDENEKRLGWFVAHVAGNGQEYIAVTKFSDHESRPKDAENGGAEAKQITLDLLSAAGLW